MIVIRYLNVIKCSYLPPPSQACYGLPLSEVEAGHSICSPLFPPEHADCRVGPCLGLAQAELGLGKGHVLIHWVYFSPYVRTLVQVNNCQCHLVGSSGHKFHNVDPDSPLASQPCHVQSMVHVLTVGGHHSFEAFLLPRT